MEANKIVNQKINTMKNFKNRQIQTEEIRKELQDDERCPANESEGEQL